MTIFISLKFRLGGVHVIIRRDIAPKRVDEKVYIIGQNMVDGCIFGSIKKFHHVLNYKKKPEQSRQSVNKKNVIKNCKKCTSRNTK